MAEGQRRRILDTGLGANILSTLTGSVSEQIQKRRDAKEALSLVFQKALAEAKIKQMFPSAEEEANQSILGMAEQAGTVPEPLGGYSPAERQRDLPNRVGQAAQQRKLEFLKYLLPGRGTATGVNVFAFHPATGEVKPSQGGQTLPPGSRVLPTRATAEEVRGVSESRAAGKAEGTPLSPDQERTVQNFAELDKAMSIIGTLLAEDPGFKGQLFATGLPFQPGAGQLADELLNASDILLQMRSRAHINEKEFTRLRS